MKRIDSRSNPTFKALLHLAEDSREQRRSGRTLIDGIHLVSAYRDKVGPVERLLVSESGCENREVSELVAANRDADTLILRDALFRELSGVATPTGIAAQIEIPAQAAASTTETCVLLDAVQDAGNVGSILRSAAAAGIGDVFLGIGCAGAWTPRVLRAAQGAHFDLQLREHCDLETLLGTYAGLSVAAVAAGGDSLFALDIGRKKLAWIFGSEGAGVRPSLLALAQRRVAIPMAPGSESLNVAAAAAICLFEGVRQQRLTTGHP